VFCSDCGKQHVDAIKDKKREKWIQPEDAKENIRIDGDKPPDTIRAAAEEMHDTTGGVLRIEYFERILRAQVERERERIDKIMLVGTASGREGSDGRWRLAYRTRLYGYGFPNL
jgi:uncharacterized Zn finger protein (UPF0148 family)